MDDGLSSYRAYDVAEDSQGFLWVGTLEGLNRYDGHAFKVFRHDDLDSTSLSNDIVRSLLVDRLGTLWVGTNDGLNEFNGKTERFTRYVNHPGNEKTIAKGRITRILEDQSGSLWIAILGGGISRFDKQRREFIQYRNDPSNPNSLRSDRVSALFEDDQGKLWMGTDGGLSVLDRSSGQFTHHFHDDKNSNCLSHNSIRDIYQDFTGILWIATEGGGLNRFDGTTGMFMHYRSSPKDPTTINHNDVSCIFQNDYRYLWIGTSDNDGGLARFDMRTETFTRFKSDPLNPRSLLHNYIRAIRQDKSGVMWIVTDRGLARLYLRTEQFQHYLVDSNPVGSQVVSSVCESRNGTLLIGIDGLRVFNAKSGSMLKYIKNNPDKPTSIRPGFVHVLYEDGHGAIWAGTTAGGLELVDPISGNVIHYDMGLGYQAGSVHTILEDKNSILWVGVTNTGLVRFDRKVNEFTVYKSIRGNPRSLSNNSVFALLEDNAGVLWIGTEGGGLNRFDRRTQDFFSFKHKASDRNSLSNDNVYDLCEDAKGRIWLATGNGLNRFKEQTGTFELYSPPPPSQTGIIARIVEDNSGRLWLSTLQNGLFRFDPESESFRHFHVHDGLQSNRFLYAAFKRGNGEIIFGGENGLNVFHPDSIGINTHIPNVVLTSFNIFQKPAQLSSSLSHIKEIMLGYNQNFFSFEFAALDFAVPAKNQYAYRLEGVDTAWVYPEKERFAPYTKVDPGEYTFRVKGSNNDGLWNEVGLSIPITITPPYWATWWFRSLIALLSIGILTSAYQYRVSKLLEMERMRVRIASDLHDDIGSSLSGIALITDMVRNHLPPDQKDRQHLMEASHAARHTADALKDIVWIINPEHDKLDDIVLRMKDSAAKLLMGIDYRFDCQENAMSSVLDMEFRRNVLLIYKETLNNIAKYAHATKVEIAVKEADKILHLRVTDNGIGFDEATIIRGNGLKNLRARAAKIGGTIEIRSAPDKGTTMQLDARIP